MKQYYEAVDVSKELPPDNNEYFIQTTLTDFCNGYYENGVWEYDNREGEQVTHWLKPVDLADVIHEAEQRGYELAKQKYINRIKYIKIN